MRMMIDPERLNFNFDDKYLRLNMGTDLGVQTLRNTGKYNNHYYIEFQVGSSGDRPHIKLYNDQLNRGQYYLTITPGYTNSQYGLPNFSYAVGSNTHARAYLPIGKGASSYNYTDIYLLANTNVKTIFGNQSIYTADGTGNIDLYEHDITITKGEGKAFLTIYSSKNTNIDSLTDLKTIAGDTFTKSCTGYINGKVIVAITETSFILSDGTTEVLTGTTFVDNPTTI